MARSSSSTVHTGMEEGLDHAFGRSRQKTLASDYVAVPKSTKKREAVLEQE